MKLGKLSDDELKQWKRALQAAKNPKWASAEDTVITSSRSYLDVAVLKEIWDSWGLDPIFDSLGTRQGRNQPLAAVAAALAINRCLDPASKSQVPSWYERTALPTIQNLAPEKMNASRIFRELSCIEECRIKLCKHLYEKMTRACPEAMQKLFYDLSSTTFSGTRCVLMKWGALQRGVREPCGLGAGSKCYWIAYLLGNVARLHRGCHDNCVAANKTTGTFSFCPSDGGI